MKKYFLILLLCCVFISCMKQNDTTLAQNITTQNETVMQNKGTIYNYTVEDISGKNFDLASLKGKKVMIVNTASECGLTPQYKELQALYEQYKENNFIILGFPANNFGAQEPGNNNQIASFCEKNYGVTFPMMSKISVKGSDMHPLYQFLTQKSKNGLSDNEVQWNFQKYLINTKGELDKVISPQTSPKDPEIISWITN